MGADLQRSHDDGGGHRPPRSSQRNLGVESAELSVGGLEAADEHRATAGGLMVRQATGTVVGQKKACRQSPTVLPYPLYHGNLSSLT